MFRFFILHYCLFFIMFTVETQTQPDMIKKPSLIACILLDATGYLSYMLPLLGEWTDIVWAPLSAYLFYRIFGGKTSKIGGIFNMIEELIPFTDFIPTFTIGYFYISFLERKETNSFKPS
jgi:hypothetical protein